MKIGKIERVERTTVQLEMGIDFQANDLEIMCDNSFRGLSKNFRENFCKLNIGKLVWSGIYDKKNRTLMVQVEKDLFVEV